MQRLAWPTVSVNLPYVCVAAPVRQLIYWWKDVKRLWLERSLLGWMGTKQAAWFGGEQRCKGKAPPALTRPCFWSNIPLPTGLVCPKTRIWKSHSRLCLPFHEIRLSQAFPFISHDTSRIAKSEKNPQMFTPTYYIFLSSPYVCWNL